MARNKNGRDFEVSFKIRSEENKKIVEGYFVRFDDKYELWNNCYETIDKNAFNNTLNHDILCLWNHDSNYPLARTDNKTLSLRVDNVGLYGVVELNENDTFASDVFERIKRGDVKQCSFGFDILDEEYITHENGETEFKITSVKLYEVSPVTFPAYTSTSISARKEDLKVIEERELQIVKTQLKERIDNIAKSVKTQ